MPWRLPFLRQRPSATIPQDPVTMLILSLPPTSLFPRAPVTVTSGSHHLGNPRHRHRGRPFSPSHGLRHLNFVSLSLPPEGPITPQPIWVPFLLPPNIRPTASLRLFQGPPTRAPEIPQPAEGAASRTARAESGGAGPRPRSLFMNGGAGGARPHYYAERRALRPRATYSLVG